MLNLWHLVNLCNFLLVALCRLDNREAYVCSLYMTTGKTSIANNKLCYLMFCQNEQKNEMLPPITDSLLQHLRQSSYQAFAWSYAPEAMQDLNSPEGHRWMIRTETLTAARLAHVDERRTTMREVGVQNPDRTHTQGFKITEENVLPLLWHLQAVRHSSLLG